jgi:hypothetical protein
VKALIKGRAAEEQDAADEVRAFTMAPSLPILVFYRRHRTTAGGGHD